MLSLFIQNMCNLWFKTTETLYFDCVEVYRALKQLDIKRATGESSSQSGMFGNAQDTWQWRTHCNCWCLTIGKMRCAQGQWETRLNMPSWRGAGLCLLCVFLALAIRTPGLTKWCAKTGLAGCLPDHSSGRRGSQHVLSKSSKPLRYLRFATTAGTKICEFRILFGPKCVFVVPRCQDFRLVWLQKHCLEGRLRLWWQGEGGLGGPLYMAYRQPSDIDIWHDRRRMAGGHKFHCARRPSLGPMLGC